MFDVQHCFVRERVLKVVISMICFTYLYPLFWGPYPWCERSMNQLSEIAGVIWVPFSPLTHREETRNTEWDELDWPCWIHDLGKDLDSSLKPSVFRVFLRNYHRSLFATHLNEKLCIFANILRKWFSGRFSAGKRPLVHLMEMWIRSLENETSTEVLRAQQKRRQQQA